MSKIRRRAGNLLGTFLLCSISACGEASSDIPLERQQELERIVRHDCGSCHGMTLKGGLGPAFATEQFLQSDDATLALIIREGVPGTPMPAWGDLLTDTEINWIIAYLKREVQNAQ